jgi:serine/threonine protein kinase
MDYFHSRGFLHRDIKPENFVINRDTYSVKMIDFGTSRDVSNIKPPYTAYVSTRWYRAPECAIRTYYYGPASDIFAIGCVMAELFLGMPIFPGSSELNQVDTIFKILGTPSKN